MSICYIILSAYCIASHHFSTYYYAFFIHLVYPRQILVGFGISYYKRLAHKAINTTHQISLSALCSELVYPGSYHTHQLVRALYIRFSCQVGSAGPGFYASGCLAGLI